MHLHYQFEMLLCKFAARKFTRYSQGVRVEGAMPRTMALIHNKDSPKRFLLNEVKLLQ